MLKRTVIKWFPQLFTTCLSSYQSVTMMHSSGHTAASMQKTLAKFKRSLKLQLKLARESSPVASLVHVSWQYFFG